MQTALSSTPSAPSLEDVLARLEGKHARIRQYMRGIFPRDSLYRLWAAAELDDATQQILYGRLALDRPNLPFDTRGDLVDFVEYFKGDDKLLCVAESVEDGALAGFLWLEDMMPPERATVNLFFRRRYRGRVSFEAARIFRDYVCEVLGFRALWGLTPWKHSAAMGRWLGMKTIAVLPRFQRIEGEMKDVYVLRYMRDG